jgi:ABC-type transporter Mla maintaining outer membrane lipid asymmetry ATPase subunit MlaF
MHAIGHRISTELPRMKLTYMSSERFMNELIHSIRYDKMIQFREKYRNIDVLLMDEPTGSIDPVATAKIEELMLDLKIDHSIVVVTHSMMEAARLADRVAYFHLGRLLEIGPTETLFHHAHSKLAREFISGKFG